jgi:transposase
MDMALKLAQLQGQHDLLKADHQRVLGALHEAELKVAKLEEERRLERARRFGASSEAGDHQANLFDEAEQHADEDAETTQDECADVEVAAHNKRHPKRKPLPADLPSVDIYHDLEDRACGCCGDEMACIGETTSEQLDVIPAQVFKRIHHRKTYSCSKCDESIKTAPLPPQPIPKSYASAGLLAHVAVAKYADGLPLYRQTKQFARLGIELPRNTLANHMIKAGQLINPLVEALKQHIQSHDIVQMDETPVQVLKEPDKVAQSKSYMWVMKGGEHPGIVYHYDPTRSQQVPQTLLPDFKGYLQTDGYAGYNGILKHPDITGLGCWAHVRRKFKDAHKALPKKDQSKGNKVTQALAYIGKLYQLEQAMKDLTPQDKTQRRQADAGPILLKFKAWLDKQSVPPQTLLGKAISYTLNQWPRLTIYTQDGRLNIDNNSVENAVRPFALGRKNWLFSDTQSGVRASANLYSLIETAKANHLNDYAYLKYVFAQLPLATNEGDIAALLPWHVDRSVIEQQLIKSGNT